MWQVLSDLNYGFSVSQGDRDTEPQTDKEEDRQEVIQDRDRERQMNRDRGNADVGGSEMGFGDAWPACVF